MSGAKLLLHDGGKPIPSALKLTAGHHSGGRRTFSRHKNDISLRPNTVVCSPCCVGMLISLQQPAWATKQQPLLRSAYSKLNRGDTRWVNRPSPQLVMPPSDAARVAGRVQEYVYTCARMVVAVAVPAR